MVTVENHFPDILRLRLSPAHCNVFRIAVGLHLVLESPGIHSSSLMNSLFTLLLLKVTLEVSLFDYSDSPVDFIDIILSHKFGNVAVIVLHMLMGSNRVL